MAIGTNVKDINLTLISCKRFLNSVTNNHGRLVVFGLNSGGRKIVYTSSSPRPLKTNREEEKTIILPLSLFTLVQSCHA
ncbi:hypothetical protein QTP88_012841 [Uroleucon formosanum]